MYEIFENLTCMNETPVYSEHKSWFKQVLYIRSKYNQQVML